jgi:hypothetical protein
VGDDDGKVAEKKVIDVGGGAGGKAKDRGCGEEAGEERKYEEEAEFCRPAYKVVVEQGGPGVLRDDEKRDALKIPERTKRRAGDEVPGAPLQVRSG